MWILYSVSSLCLCCPSFSLSCLSFFFLLLEIWMKAPPLGHVALHGPESNVIFRFHPSILTINYCITPLLLLYSIVFFSHTGYFPRSPTNATSHQYCCMLPAASTDTNFGSSFPLFFFRGLCPLYLPSAFLPLQKKNVFRKHKQHLAPDSIADILLRMKNSIKIQ